MGPRGARGQDQSPDEDGRPGVVDVRGVDSSRLLAPGPARRQSLAGFDPDYVDIVDYIVRCTHKIWEEKNAGLIYTHYLHDSVIHSDDSETYGREAVTQGTLRSIAAYPDERCFADDVVWTGNDVDGFYTSHRNTTIARNTGATFYGPPTNRQVRRTGIALCYVRENRIIEEWIVRDDLAVIQCLGLDLEETVAQLARGGSGNLPAHEMHGEIEQTEGQTEREPHRGDAPAGFDIDEFARRTLDEVWNRRMLGELQRAYAADYICHTMGDRNLHGRGQYAAWVLAILAAFPDSQLVIDQLFWMDDGAGRYRTSLRWSLCGTHAGAGMFGQPTGVRCRLWGITQHHIRDGRFTEEWTYTNELSVRKRIWRARNGELNHARR